MTRLIGIGPFLQLVDVAVGNRGGLVQQVGGRRFFQRVVGLGDQNAVCVEQIDHRIQAVSRMIDVEPDLGSCHGREAVHVDIVAFVEQSLDRETETQVLIGLKLRGS